MMRTNIDTPPFFLFLSFISSSGWLVGRYVYLSGLLTLINYLLFKMISLCLIPLRLSRSASNYQFDMFCTYPLFQTPPEVRLYQTKQTVYTSLPYSREDPLSSVRRPLGQNGFPRASPLESTTVTAFSTSVWGRRVVDLSRR
jgi:hypothetical protein